MKILEILTKRRKIGNVGERAAARYLRKNGYKILERNYVACGYETDIIAKRDETVSFVEVKTRTVGHESLKEPRPASSVTPEKQRKLISCAKSFMSLNYTLKARMRFDVIEVMLDEQQRVQKINHLISAFNYNTAYKTNRKDSYK